MTLFSNLSPLRHHGAILNSITYINSVCSSVSAAPRGYVFYVVYALIWTKTVYPRDTADTEQHTLLTFSGYSTKMAPGWHEGEELLSKVIILVFFENDWMIIWTKVLLVWNDNRILNTFWVNYPFKLTTLIWDQDIRIKTKTIIKIILVPLNEIC